MDIRFLERSVGFLGYAAQAVVEAGRKNYLSAVPTPAGMEQAGTESSVLGTDAQALADPSFV